MTAPRWGWADKGKKGHWFPDATDRAKCGKATLLEEADVPEKDRCAACKKAAAAADLVTAKKAVSDAPTRVVDWFVRTPPGADSCPSVVHAADVVRATVAGTMTDASTKPGERRVWCSWCATVMSAVGFFVPDDGHGRCVRCTGVADLAHSPCCVDRPLPHGRDLCCHCYGQTHGVKDTPCH